MLDGPGRVRVAVEDYDRSRPLVIDPVLTYATYFGGNAEDNGGGIHVDATGITFGGNAVSTDLPAPGGVQAENAGGFDAFVAKLDPSGASLVYATYYGGSGDEIERDLAVDAAGNAYLFGETTSTDLPTTPGALDRACGGDGLCDGVVPVPDTFVAKLDPSGGALAYATYLGGSGFDRCFGVGVDGGGRAVVVGSTLSTDFPATAGAFDPSCGSDGLCDGGDDAVAAMLDAAGASLVYATFLGGSGDGDSEIEEYAWAVDVDASGRAYLVGQTDSSDFPTPNGARTSYGGGALDAFVAQLDATGSALAYATYLGGVGTDQGLGIAADSTGKAHATGVTDSGDFPLVAALSGPGNACENCGQHFTEGFVTTLDASGGSLFFSSFLGGSNSDYAVSVTVAGTALYVLGDTASGDFPTQDPFQAMHGSAANYDAFVARVPEPSAALLSLASAAMLALLAGTRSRR